MYEVFITIIEREFVRFVFQNKFVMVIATGCCVVQEPTKERRVTGSRAKGQLAVT